MNLPKVITNLIEAQNNSDSITYSNCFAKTAVVFDEGNTHKGKVEIQHWIAEANKKYKTVMNPIEYDEAKEILKTKVSGTFDGSPVILSYHFEILDGLIQSLKITG